MKTLIALLLCSLTSAVAIAEEGFSLPVPVYDAMRALTRQTTCEAGWPEMAAKIGVETDALDEDSLLMIVPCSRWTHNVSYAVFVLTNEPSHEDGFITRPVLFVDHSPYQKISAQPVIHNVKWNRESKTLTTHYFLNGKEECGTHATYVWNPAQFTLQLQKLEKQDDCQADGGLWDISIEQ